jgi:2-polyprenyl-3-methyl-5-hydroxy-6-metoxy-1,4-benzoquinol methylase
VPRSTDNIEEMRAVNMFDFGANWQDYSRHKLDDAQISVAQNALSQLIGTADLAGKSFLDIGCGSGLHCLAAAQLGATPIIGFDINPKCTVLSQANALRFGNSHRFETLSVLDAESMAKLGTFDIVYAWGSLHHTGEMHQAIRNAAARVAPKGRFILAIYNESVTSPVWRVIKRGYNTLPNILKKIMVASLIPAIWLAKLIVTRKNPLSKERGMNFYYDAVDWIGGHPYEYASANDIVHFVEALGFRCDKIVPPTTPIGCNEFVFYGT